MNKDYKYKKANRILKRYKRQQVVLEEVKKSADFISAKVGRILQSIKQSKEYDE